MLCLDDDKFHATSNCVDFAVVVESLEKSSSHVEGWDEICNERIVWWCLHRHHNRMKSAILASTSITLSFIMSSTKWHLQNPFEVNETWNITQKTSHIFIKPANFSPPWMEILFTVFQTIFQRQLQVSGGVK